MGPLNTISWARVEGTAVHQLPALPSSPRACVDSYFSGRFGLGPITATLQDITCKRVLSAVQRAMEHTHCPRVPGSWWLGGAEADSLLPSPRHTASQMGHHATSLPPFSSSIEWGEPNPQGWCLLNDIVQTTEAMCPKLLTILLGVK